jgi:hypothetical protein
LDDATPENLCMKRPSSSPAINLVSTFCCSQLRTWQNIVTRIYLLLLLIMTKFFHF